MNTSKILNILLFILAVPAGAVPVAPVKHLSAGCDPQRVTQSEHFKDLIQKVSIIGEDSRRELSEIQKNIGFSKTEMQQAMACTGFLACPGANGGRGSYASAASVRSSDQLATVRHLFVNEDGSTISRVGECYFENYLGQRTQVLTDQNRIQQKSNPRLNVRNDHMVVKLKDQLRDCDPYEVDASEEPMDPGQKFISLSHIQAGMPSKYRGTSPIAQECEVKNVFDAVNGSPSIYYSDCDSTPGGSGGINVMRMGSEGKLKFKGIIAGGGSLDQNGKQYNEAQKNMTISVGMDSGFLQLALDKTEVARVPQQVIPSLPHLKPTSK